MAAVVAAVLALLLLGLWSQRKPIARGFVDRELRARGVPAQYIISDLGPGRQRLRGVVIGDPAAPDLTASEVELRIGYGFGWPSVQSITARGVRLRGRLVDGSVSLGSLDRMMPASSGGPFALPDLALDLADTQMRLETPAGPVVLDIAGRGELTDGFAGTVKASAPRLGMDGCVVEQPSATLAIRIADRQPSVSGPVRAARIACGGVVSAAPRIALAATLAETLHPLSARIGFASGAIAHPRGLAGAVRGQVDFDGRDRRNMHGAVALTVTDPRLPEGTARSLRMDGRYRVGGAVTLASGWSRPLRFDAEMRLGGMRIPERYLGAVTDGARSAGSTPLAPLALAFAQAATAAARDSDARGRIAFDGDIVRRGGALAAAGEAHVPAIALASRSGARLTFSGGDGVRIDVADRSVRVDGTADLRGGGFPSARVTVRQAAPGKAMTGEAEMAPYAVGGARLALAPVRFARDAAGGLRVNTAATIDGPLGDGRVTGLSLPITARYGKALLVNEGCAPLGFSTLTIAGVRLGATTLPLCPTGGAMLRVDGGVVSGGMAVPRPRLNGRVGAQPLTITAADLRVDIGTPGFTANALAVRLGEAANPTRLDVAQLVGRVDSGGVGGRFTGADGQIRSVPLLLSGGEGTWRLAGGRLGLAAKLTVADADANPRFVPLVSQDVTLDLTGGVIRASGIFRESKSGLAVTEVVLNHDLGVGTGNASLHVPGITFGPAFQPERLTRLTLGVIANVVGTVSGKGSIAWNGDGVTSEGDFATENVDLAAVFGPVTGIKGKIHFSDLLALKTPPGQLVTVAAFNPGIAVEGGVIGYQLLEGQKIAVGGGKWPFSGGSLILEPTILDFGQPVERRMTFRVEGLQAGAFLEQFDFKNISVTGVFDGVLPMIFDQTGGRISGGRLVVRKGGGTLAYVGELTNADLGTFGKLAFDALKSIRYDNLAIELDGALDSEIVSRIVFTGTNENPVEKKRPGGLLRNLTGLPFKFNIVVRAPFRGLTNSASAFVNPGALLGGAVKDGTAVSADAPATPPATATPAVQPPLSEDKR